MNNSLYYRQTNEEIGSNPTAAAALCQCIGNPLGTFRLFFAKFLGVGASVTAAAARKIEDNSDTGPEETVIAIDDLAGALTGICATSQQWCFVMFRNTLVDNKNVWRNLYLGGISESVLSGIRVGLVTWTEARDSFLTDVRIPFFDGSEEIPFELVLPSTSDFSQPAVSWEGIDSVNPAFYLTRKNSRRLRAAL